MSIVEPSPATTDVHTLAVADAARICVSPNVERCERQRAVESLVVLHTGLIRREAARFGRADIFDDLTQSGMVGLLNAIQRYDPARGDLTAYAVSCVRGEMKKFLRTHAWAVHVPRSLQVLAADVAAVRAELEAFGDATSTEAIAAHLRVDPGRVQQAELALTARYRTCEITDIDVATSEYDFAAIEIRETFQAVLENLDPNDRHLIELRLILHLTQDQIAEATGWTQAYVSRQLDRIIARLQCHPELSLG